MKSAQLFSIRTTVTLSVVVLLAGTVLISSCKESVSDHDEQEVLLGGLFSLTGNWSTLGLNGEAALAIGVEDVNRYLAGNAAGIRFATAVEDTRLEPDRALERAQELRRRGVQLLIGAQSSAEVERLKPFVDENGLLLISPSSTAGALAIPGDNVFRFTPSDSLEGIVIVAMMWEDGVRSVVPIWRDDLGNAGLEKAARSAVDLRGGEMAAGVSYSSTTPDFDGAIGAIRNQVQAAVAQHGADKVAVYLAAFDEAADVLERASTDPVLGSVRWYGGDGVAHSQALLASGTAASFAMAHGFPSPVFGLELGARDIWEPVAARIRARTNLQPDAFALAVYDAVWVVARGYVASGATTDIEKLKQAFVTAASTGYGATGWTILNAAGDRLYGDFDFWAIRDDGNGAQWRRVAQYETRTGRLVRMGPVDGSPPSVIIQSTIR